MISVSMIVKNEQACLATALKSVRGADEIIVCDTGSTDRTVEIARQYTDNVYTDYQWNDNFAEARNHCLSKCTGDWVLVIDADERLEPGGIEKIRKVLETIGEHRAVYFNTVAMTANHSHRSIRLFKNNVGIYWKGAAHNYLSESKGLMSELVMYYGYSDAHKADPDRTFRILRKAVQADPTLSRETFYLAREHWYRKQYTEAIAAYKQYLAVAFWGPEIAEANLAIAKCYRALGDQYQARRYTLEAMAVNADFREAFLMMAALSGPRNKKRWLEIAETAKNENVLFIREGCYVG